MLVVVTGTTDVGAAPMPLTSAQFQPAATAELRGVTSHALF